MAANAVKALFDPQFRADVSSGTSDALNRGLVAQTIGAPADLGNLLANALRAGYGTVGRMTGLLKPEQMPDLVEHPMLGSEWWGQKMQDAGAVSGNRNELAEALAGGLLGPAIAARTATLKAPVSSQPDKMRSDARSSAVILDPKPATQRPFNADYPRGAATADDGRLLVDIEGRSLGAPYVAGRRMGGGVDEGIPSGDLARIAEALGIRVHAAAKSSPELKGDAGRFTSGGGSRNVYIDKALPADKAGMVLSHELGHGLDDLAQLPLGAGGAKIPTAGLSKELRAVYENLNTGGWFKPGRGASPEGRGYASNVAESELMAEAIRAYLRDPNYLKTLAPKTAARIREHMNANPNTRNVIQFNEMATGAAGAGLLGGGLLGERE